VTRVRLSPLRSTDSATLFRWINDRELVELNAPFRRVARAQHDKWFSAIRKRKDVAIFAIRLTESDRLIGSCQLHSIDATHRSAELQIRIGEADALGRGYGVEAIRRLVAHGFRKLKLHRVWLRVFVTNRRAVSAYRKAGFRKEGLMRDAALVNGRFVDVVVMGITRRA
jgi:RimJ/RimL family protein N-acetyltransferase